MDDDVGFWDIIISTFWFMLLVAWFWMVIHVLADMFRDRELSGWAKALWALFIVVIPWLGVLVYLLTRGASMNERERERVLERQAMMRGYAQPSGGANLSGELRALAELRDSGVLTLAEYEQAKAKALT
ncbi:MAG: SHOCT domain-containing protein [Aeromicrobium sp.]